MASPELWAHQKAFVERARREPHVAAFMEPGTGKTRAAIEALREDYNAHKRVAKTLIICPLSTCKQWEKAFRENTKISEASVAALTGTGSSRAKKIDGGGIKVCITNFEGIRIGNFYESLLTWSPEIVVVDESHRIKDAASVTSKKLFPLSIAARRRFILTGTPVLNSMLDIFGQYKVLDPRYFGPSFWKFRARYFFDRNAGMPPHLHFPDWQPQRDAAKEIAKILEKTAIQAKKSECLDLPERLDVIVPIEMSSDQRAHYDEMMQEYVTELNDVEATAEFAMTKSLRLRQIVAGFVSETSSKEAAHIESLPRLKVLSELLDSLQGKQVIIWTDFVPTFAKIGDVCSKLGLTYTFLTGQQSTQEKEIAKTDFISGKAQVIISNPSAGGTGVDGLQCSQYAIYYTHSFSAEHFWQSRDRNYRAGSERHDKVTHYHLMCEESIDQVVYDALMNKEKIGAALLSWARRGSGNSVRKRDGAVSLGKGQSAGAPSEGSQSPSV